MADDVQALLDRIQEQGVSEANAEKERILAAARNEAESIRKQAKEDAENVRSEAKREAELLEQKGKAALQQAARDTLLSLRHQLENRVSALSKATAGEALGSDTLAGLIGDVVRAQANDQAEVGGVEIGLPAEKKAALADALLKRLRKELQQDPGLKPVPRLEGGFQLRFEGEDMVYDFSDDALSEVLSHFLNPKLAAILQEAGS